MLTWILLTVALITLVLVVLVIIRLHEKASFNNEGIFIEEKQDRTEEILSAIEGARQQTDVLGDELLPLVKRTDQDIGWLLKWAKRFGRDDDRT